jgi:DNA-binding MarR family transcriptional regulator
VKELHDTLDRLHELVVLLNGDMTRSLAREGLTVPRAHLLWHLHHHGPCTQRTLADALAVTPRNITGLVDGLVASGHVTREPHPSDRRATLVSLTEQAAATLAEMDAQHKQLAWTLFGDMPDFPAFTAGLDHVAAAMRRARPSSREGRPLSATPRAGG